MDLLLCGGERQKKETVFYSYLYSIILNIRNGKVLFQKNNALLKKCVFSKFFNRLNSHFLILPIFEASAKTGPVKIINMKFTFT
jgi:hypothetical protein